MDLFMSNARIKNAFDEAIFLMDQSIAYFESAKVLVDSPSEYTSMPIITLQSFSLECSLKSLLLLTCGKYPSSHDVLDLFERLPEDEKKALLGEFLDLTEVDLKNALTEIRRDFIGSRYYFEDFRKSYVGRAFSTGYLEAVANFFIDYIKDNGDSIYQQYGSGSSVTCSPNVMLSTKLER